MTDNQDKTDQLFNKLEILLKRQDEFSIEINNLKHDINKLKTSEINEAVEKEKIVEDSSIANAAFEIKKEKAPTYEQTYGEQTAKQPPQTFSPRKYRPLKIKSNLEKFIGENLINKIGIAITVIGVSIGTKYAIDHELISPLTRIILGYLFGLGLLGVAIRLKKDYDNFSAVLLSGGMAILYFITYFAYTLYGLIPEVFAFILMLIFTAFTVLAALKYNKQVIAHIGLVGAYAVPFLLGDNYEKTVLFSYTTIINIGILIIAFQKYWKPLYYSSFVITWMMYYFWFESEFQIEEHLGLALTFLTIFFIIFYLTFLAYKLIKKEKFEIFDVLLLLLNSFIFFGVGYDILNGHETGKQLLGLFAICNAIIHFIVSGIIYKQKLADRNLFYLISGLVLLFITIAIPIQLDGNWVTLLWVGEAALLFWIGRTKNVPFYEMLSYALMILAFFSILHDWGTAYHHYIPEQAETRITTLFNIHFLTSFLFILAFGFINFLNQNKKFSSALISQKDLFKLVSFSIPAILIFTLYNTFRIEIATYWDQLFLDSNLTTNTGGEDYSDHYRNYDLMRFKVIWIINYSLFFVSILSFINIKKLRNQQLGLINLGLNTLTIAVFLIGGLYVLSELRESFLDQTLAEYYQIGIFNLGIRYISFVFVALTLVACFHLIRKDFINKNYKMYFDILLYTSILWILSSELINWMDIGDSTKSYKLGLSILWGIYSLLIIALGIWKMKKYLRIGAIALFGFTLIKLFFYDVAYLDTISKTILFVSLGILLLIISFLYNKYKHLIADETDS